MKVNHKVNSAELQKESKVIKRYYEFNQLESATIFIKKILKNATTPKKTTVLVDWGLWIINQNFINEKILDDRSRAKWYTLFLDTVDVILKKYFQLYKEQIKSSGFRRQDNLIIDFQSMKKVEDFLSIMLQYIAHTHHILTGQELIGYCMTVYNHAVQFKLSIKQKPCLEQNALKPMIILTAKAYEAMYALLAYFDNRAYESGVYQHGDTFLKAEKKLWNTMGLFNFIKENHKRLESRFLQQVDSFKKSIDDCREKIISFMGMYKGYQDVVAMKQELSVSKLTFMKKTFSDASIASVDKRYDDAYILLSKLYLKSKLMQIESTVSAEQQLEFMRLTHDIIVAMCNCIEKKDLNIIFRLKLLNDKYLIQVALRQPIKYTDPIMFHIFNGRLSICERKYIQAIKQFEAARVMAMHNGQAFLQMTSLNDLISAKFEINDFSRLNLLLKECQKIYSAIAMFSDVLPYYNMIFQLGRSIGIMLCGNIDKLSCTINAKQPLANNKQTLEIMRSAFQVVLSIVLTQKKYAKQTKLGDKHSVTASLISRLFKHYKNTCNEAGQKLIKIEENSNALSRLEKTADNLFNELIALEETSRKPSKTRKPPVILKTIKITSSETRLRLPKQKKIVVVAKQVSPFDQKLSQLHVLLDKNKLLTAIRAASTFISSNPRIELTQQLRLCDFIANVYFILSKKTSSLQHSIEYCREGLKKLNHVLNKITLINATQAPDLAIIKALLKKQYAQYKHKLGSLKKSIENKLNKELEIIKEIKAAGKWGKHAVSKPISEKAKARHRLERLKKSVDKVWVELHRDEQQLRDIISSSRLSL